MAKPAQKGIAHIGLLLLVVVVAAIAFTGYKLEQSHNKSDNSPKASSNIAQSTLQVPTINTKADLNTAETTLNNENIDGDLNPDNYNQDISSLQ